MNTLRVFLRLLLLRAAIQYATADEASLLGELPDLGQEWQAGSAGERSEGIFRCAWATFTNVRTGEIISFAAQRYEGSKPTVRDDPINQSSDDMFPEGFPRFARPEVPDQSGWSHRELRRKIVELVAIQGRGRVKAEALEYSLIYEPREGSGVKLLGHGYVLCFGEPPSLSNTPRRMSSHLRRRSPLPSQFSGITSSS